MKRWTEAEDRILMKYASRGVAECRRQISRRLGIKRTEAAIQRHGSRLGISFARYEVCPHCSKAVRKLNQVTGICPECSAYANRDRALQRKREILASEGALASEKLARVKREYNAARQWNRKHS